MVSSTQDISSNTGSLCELAALILPMSEQEFFQTYYGKTPFCWSDRLQCSPLVTLADMVARVQCLKLEFGLDYSIARDGERISPIFQASLAMNSDWLSKLLNDNWTLIVNAVQRDFYPLNRLAVRLAGSLKSGVNINVYYTPAGAMGFDFHRDQHDVFIWQQRGKKAWKVIAQGAAYDTNPVIDTVLGPGQALYIPENCRHAAVACPGEDSLHLTIGFSSRFAQAKKLLRRQIDAWMESKMTEGLADLALPHQLPDQTTNISKDEALQAVEALRQRLSREMDKGVDPYPICETLERQLSPDEAANMLAESDLDGPFTLIESGRIEPTQESGVTLDFPTGSLVFKEEFREALHALCQLRTFHRAELPMAASTALALCRVLVGAGVLRSGIA